MLHDSNLLHDVLHEIINLFPSDLGGDADCPNDYKDLGGDESFLRT